MRWFYYFVAVVATALACLLWLFVFGRFSGASSVPDVGPVVFLPVVPAGQLPVPPRLRPADSVCVGGRFVRERRTAEGYAYDVEVRIGGKVVRCR